MLARALLTSCQCFKYIVTNPPRPLTEEDIWFQIGHVYEQQKEVWFVGRVASVQPANCHPQFNAAKNAYRRVLDRDPNHAKVLQQLGWLHHQQSQDFQSQEQAIEYLEKSVSSGKSCVPIAGHAHQTDCWFRQCRRTELVPAWALLHVTAEIRQGV